MEGYKNILCATDFSTLCTLAAERAAEMARRYGAQLTLLHIVEHFPVDRSNVVIAPEDIDPKLYREENARASLAKLSKHLGNNNVEQVVRFCPQSAGYEILRFIDEQNPDLIVIASHGRHGITSVLGSTTYCLTHKAPCDVMAIRANL